MAGIHSAAQVGFSHGAAHYERGRPGYPPGIVRWLRERIGLQEAKTPYLFRRGEWCQAFAGGILSEPDTTVLEHEYTGTARQVIVERALSLSFIALLPPAEQDTVAIALNNLILGHPQLAGRETVAFPYRTFAYRSVALHS